MRPTTLLVLVSSVLWQTGCSAQEDDASSSPAAMTAVSESTLRVADVTRVVDRLTSQRTSAPLGKYYEDGSRLEGCWRNPAGARLTDLKKAFYCAMPLEFRLCNSVLLLTTDDADVDKRFSGYLDCQKKVDRVFSGKVSFVYDDETNALYKQLFLQGATLPKDDEAQVIAANKPTFSDRSFEGVLAAIAKTLTAEAIDLASTAFTSLVANFKSETESSPR
jgi:hypothetical protein